MDIKRRAVRGYGGANSVFCRRDNADTCELLGTMGGKLIGGAKSGTKSEKRGAKGFVKVSGYSWAAIANILRNILKFLRQRHNEIRLDHDYIGKV